MGPALTDQPKNSKNGNSLVDECAFQSPPACVCWTPIVKQKSRSTPPFGHSVEGDCALNFWKGSLPPPKVLTRNLNSRHPGGAIYQFSRELTVDFLRSEKSHELPRASSKIEKSKSDKSQVRLKYTMPHTARCCNDPYGS